MNNWYVSIHGGWKFGEDWDDTVKFPRKEKDICLRTEEPKYVGQFDPVKWRPCDEVTDYEGIIEWPAKFIVDKEADVDVETDGGPRIGGAVGYYFGNLFAFEIEGAWMGQDLEEAHIDKIIKTKSIETELTDLPPEIEGKLGEEVIECDSDWCTQELDGDLSIITLMGNLIVGFPVGEGVIRPYVGVGAGVAFVSFDDIGLKDHPDSDWNLDDDDTTFALQAFAGLDFMVSQNVSLGVRGRVLHIGDVDLKDSWDLKHELDPDLMPSVEAVLTFALP